MGQIATALNTREPGRFTSQPEVNPRRHEQEKATTKATTLLKSGIVIEKSLGDKEN